MAYKIKISYETGNSFGRHDEIDYVEYEWSDIEEAKLNLKRIKNHYKFYNENGDLWSNPECELPEGVIWNEEYRCILLEFILNGDKITYSPFWTGYFETLYYAEIEDEDLKFEPF